MADVNHVIEPERHGIWIAATFVIALLALILALIGLKQINELHLVTQTEILMLNKQIQDGQAAAPAAAPAEPAAAQ